jgi:uncharacterized membrane protein
MLKRIQNNMLASLLAIIPILLTLWIVGFLIDFLIATGTPPVLAFADWIRAFAVAPENIIYGAAGAPPAPQPADP